MVLLLRWARDAQIVYEDDKVIAFLDKFPQAFLCPFFDFDVRGPLLPPHVSANERAPRPTRCVCVCVCVCLCGRYLGTRSWFRRSRRKRYTR